MKVLTIGGATQDVFLRYEGADLMHITRKHTEQSYMIFKSGEKIDVEELLFFTGGGASNTAVSFQRLGLTTAVFCKIGNDPAGSQILEELEKEGVDTSYIIKTDEHTSGVSFIVNSLRGEETIFAFRGANKHLSEKELPLKEIDSCDQLYITSLSDGSAQILPALMKYAQKKKIHTTINPGTSQLQQGTATLKDALPYADTLILNSAEAKLFMLSLVDSDIRYKDLLGTLEQDRPSCPVDITGQTPRLLHDAIRYENCLLSTKRFFSEILRMGTSMVVITDGCHGVYAAHDKELIFCPALQGTVIDTLGAGDAFGSAFIASIAQGSTVEAALINGNINSTSVISQIGAKPGLLSQKELTKRAKKVPKKLIQRFTLED